MHRSVIPSLFSFNFPVLFLTLLYASFDISDTSPRDKRNRLGNVSIAELHSKFKEFSSPLINNGISIYTDGSMEDVDSVGAAVYSPDFGLAIT